MQIPPASFQSTTDTFLTKVHSNKIIFTKGVQKQSLAGEYLADQIKTHLTQRKIQIVPQYQIKQKEPVEVDQPAKFLPKDLVDTHPSFHDFAVDRVIHDYKTSVCATLESPMDIKYDF